MEIENRINSDLKEAIKSGDAFTRDVLRFLVSDLKNKAINDRKELTEEDIFSIVKKNIKSRKDSIEQFTKGGREDLAETEKKEVEILEKYMPKQLTEEEIESIVREVIDQADSLEVANFGVIMKKVMAETQGKADGGIVSNAVKKALANL